MRALASHQCGAGSTPGVDAICGLSLLLVLSCFERFFSRYSGFPLSSKTNTFKFQFDLERTDTFKRVHTNKYLLGPRENDHSLLLGHVLSSGTHACDSARVKSRDHVFGGKICHTGYLCVPCFAKGLIWL